MKKNDNWKIQIKARRTFGGDEYRHVYYRIDPSELPFLARVFANPWRRLYTVYDSGYVSDIFSVNRFVNVIKPMETMADVRWYIEIQNKRYDDVNEMWKK